jgi:hypothetical protein
MKKKNLISLVVAGVLVCSMMTGCGGNTAPTSDEIPVAEESTQETEAEGTVETVETVEPTTEETEATEATTETVETEAVADDFLSQNGLAVTPNGDATVQLAIGAGDAVTDDVEDVTVNVKFETYERENGYVTTSFVVTVPVNEEGNTYNISAFDRYTGTSFESVASNLDNGSVNQSGVVVDVDGNKYDCSLSADAFYDVAETMLFLSVTHPAEYDGVVFMFGPRTKTQMTAYNNIDFNSTFTVADYADVFIDGQAFFTVSGK